MGISNPTEELFDSDELAFESIPTSRPDGRVFVQFGAEQVEIISAATDLPSEAELPRHEASFLKAARESLGAQCPDQLAIRSFSRAVFEPASALAKLRAPLDATGAPQGRVRSVRADLWSVAVIPGPQPRGRTGLEHRSTPDPEVTHSRDGLIKYVFDSPRHFVNHTIDAVARTISGAVKRGRPAEILATGVRRDVTTHLAEIAFRDGSVSQFVLVVRDGITRWASTQLLIHGLAGADAVRDSRVIVDEMLPYDALTGRDSRALSKRWQARSKRLATEYRAGVTSQASSERALTLRQALRLPATTYFAMDQPATDMAAAIERIVADMHTDVEKWSEDDEDFHNARSLFASAHEAGYVPDHIASLVREPGQPAAALQRAVSIAYFAMGAGFEDLKTQMRRQGLGRKVRREHVSRVIAPLLTEPWSSVKGTGKAWRYRGALPEVGTETPTHPANYLDLVAPAARGEVEAMTELRVAGSIALLATDVVSSSLVGGSGAARDRTVPLMSFDTLFEGLVRTERGLTQLALAANAFDPSGRNNPFPVVNLEAPGQAWYDGGGFPSGPDGEPLTQKVLATLAQEGVATAQQGVLSIDAGADTDTPAARLLVLKDQVERSLVLLTELLDETETARREAGEFARAYGEVKSQELNNLANKVQQGVLKLGMGVS